jgi:hypothetical protein
MQIYLLGIPFFERQQKGCCREIHVTYENLSYHSGVTGKMNEHLTRLRDLGLIEFQPGEQRRNRPTQIRRLSTDELKRSPDQKINAPDHALALAEILNVRSFFYGNQIIQPTWKAAKTGRILSSKPNVQGDNKERRGRCLKSGLKKNEFLFELDFKQAEPTIILNRLKTDGLFTENFEGDIYEQLARQHNANSPQTHWDREQAKAKLNGLAYTRKGTCSHKVETYWGLPQDSVFRRYAAALDQLRDKLFEQGRGQDQLRRHVQTIGGTIIQKDVRESKQVKRGQVLSWYAQGSVADIANRITKKLLEEEKKGRLKFYFPVHDSFYISGQDETLGDRLKRKMENYVQKRYGLNLTVTTKKW